MKQQTKGIVFVRPGSLTSESRDRLESEGFIVVANTRIDKIEVHWSPWVERQESSLFERIFGSKA